MTKYLYPCTEKYCSDADEYQTPDMKNLDAAEKQLDLDVRLKEMQQHSPSWKHTKHKFLQ